MQQGRGDITECPPDLSPFLRFCTHTHTHRRTHTVHIPRHTYTHSHTRNTHMRTYRGTHTSPHIQHNSTHIYTHTHTHTHESPASHTTTRNPAFYKRLFYGRYNALQVKIIYLPKPSCVPGFSQKSFLSDSDCLC